MKHLRIYSIVLFFVLASAGHGFAQITKDEALSEFVRAGNAYKDGRYDAAISHYEGILKGKRASGPVYYNLGNSYYKKRNVGRTILNYERAKLLMPRDSDLKFNYQYVHSQINQKGSYRITDHVSGTKDNERLLFLQT